MVSSIRPRSDDDIPGCVEVLRLVYAKDGYPVQGTENAVAMLKDEAIELAWIAELDHHIVGHVTVSKASETDISVARWRTMHPDEPLAVLGKLFVHPERRGDGTAARLIQAAVTWAQGLRRRLVLFALVKDQGAIRLYGRLGWINFGSTTYRYGDGLEMEAVCFASPETV